MLLQNLISGGVNISPANILVSEFTQLEDTYPEASLGYLDLLINGSNVHLVGARESSVFRRYRKLDKSIETFPLYKRVINGEIYLIDSISVIDTGFNLTQVDVIEEVVKCLQETR